MSTVQLKGIAKKYTDNYAVKGVDIDIKDGEFIVLVGPSGCGKTTTLRMIAGLEEISDGQLFIDGEVANDLSPAERGIAMVFQSYALYPHMTVEENLNFGLRLQGMPKAEIDAAVKNAASILHIEHLLDRKPKALSGGQRQRVAIGRAITRTPKVFLFDEPLSNLDASLRVQMRIEFARLHEEAQSNHDLCDPRSSGSHDFGGSNCRVFRRSRRTNRFAIAVIPSACKLVCGGLYWLTKNEFDERRSGGIQRAVLKSAFG